MKFSHSRQQGFTLIELLVWMAITAVLLGAVGSYFSATVKAWLDSRSKFEVRTSASILTNDLISNLHGGHDYKLVDNNPNFSAATGQAIQFTAPPLNSSTENPPEVVQIIYRDSTTKQLMLFNTATKEKRKLYGQGSNIIIELDSNSSSSWPLFIVDPNSTNESVTIHFKLVNPTTTDPNTHNPPELAISTMITSAKSTFELQ
ncbi:MAG: prepilin-type N-terminal cleavage/methylation domain-containing protein [Sporomusaceae bacterium]|nr:prepilin-type N-terminal cleavage/methylation domain-containing protein [Sporomusaceae bacterium]